MEHINIFQDRTPGYVRLIPEKGYNLFNTATNTTYSEAIVKESEIGKFVAVPIEAGE